LDYNLWTQGVLQVNNHWGLDQAWVHSKDHNLQVVGLLQEDRNHLLLIKVRLVFLLVLELLQDLLVGMLLKDNRLLLEWELMDLCQEEELDLRLVVPLLEVDSTQEVLLLHLDL
jgi:hypothetical protein